MNTVIYYFTGTGNSLYIASEIAKKIDVKLISISSLLHQEKIKTDAASIGFVFPDYHSNLPNIVRNFIGKMEDLSGKYIFGVCTYGGTAPGCTIKYLKQYLKRRNGKLSLGFAVKMPYNYIVPVFELKSLSTKIKLKEITQSEQQNMFTESIEKVALICEAIKNKKEGVLEITAEFLFKILDLTRIKDWLGKGIWLKMAGYHKKNNLTFFECLALLDHGFFADEKCIGCGNCEKICPVADIVLINQKPVWQHRCEQCFACLQRCPREAIQFGAHTAGLKRYHQPEISFVDMVKN